MFDKFFANLKSAELEKPAAPLTASPTPWLTSLHTRNGRGPYGNSAFRGNCSGLLNLTT